MFFVHSPYLVQAMKTKMDEKGKEQPIEVLLQAEEECVGFYERLQVAGESVGVILKLCNGRTVKISFLTGSVEERTLRKKLRAIKVGDKIGILKIRDVKHPIRIRKIQFSTV